MRILGLDFGSKTVGVAVSDENEFLASGVETIRREREDKLRKTYARIEALIVELGVEKIVLGLPLTLDGEEGVRVQKTRDFGENLQRRTGLDIEYQDERLTTVEAYNLMSESGVKKDKQLQMVDEVAATIILQDYLDAKKG
ncbi:MAG: Holliday junction resolvase RuvX [Lachnospiraceae bacterium]|jgi:putative Holliday junction resolvase|nr:Holliday junction resolvase RuvX [Lachnospiraceae bacterium]